MQRAELEHLIRAAGAITGLKRLVVIGSQSILGALPQAPLTLLESREADLMPFDDDPRASDLIDGVLGERSVFDDTFGYHAQGVDSTTAVLPDGWRERLVRIANDNTSGIEGWCLDPHDLFAAKYVANRPKDRQFLRAAHAAGILLPQRLIERVAALPIEHAERARILQNLNADTQAPPSPN
jgi:hypothetical protein